jgi:hypothetical protein
LVLQRERGVSDAVTDTKRHSGRGHGSIFSLPKWRAPAHCTLYARMSRSSSNDLATWCHPSYPAAPIRCARQHAPSLQIASAISVAAHGSRTYSALRLGGDVLEPSQRRSRLQPAFGRRGRRRT